MSQAAVSGPGERAADWIPPEPIPTPPVFVWPPRPRAFLRFLFGFPGYLWPWNLLYVAIALPTWLWLTPDLARMKSFAPGWIAFLLARNLALLTLVISAWHVPLYVRRVQGTRFKYRARWLAQDNAAFLFRNQLRDNVFWTLASGVPIWTAYEALTYWAQANGLIPTMNWKTQPLFGVALMLFIPLFREVHFYLIHRLIHWPPLYRAVHSLHHANVNPGPWSGLSMHPVEHLLYFSGVLLHWIVPSSPLHVIYHLQHLAFAPSQGHSGFGRVALGADATVPNDHYFHYLHHKYFEVNYGGDGTVPLDRWFGTFHDGSAAAEAAMNRRVLGRRR
ncbi:MAG TPA: sterol desaturase family protein [Acetobacteraceae bacterium]|nr:sterol desaturase family protein [Acetobacteraceae bacterium]